MTEESEVSVAPNWLKELEAKRERRLKVKLGHEAGAGAPCLNCGDKCSGLDLHFWRKICKTCKCSKEDHDVPDDDIYSWAQFELLGSKPNKIRHKIVLPGKKDEVELEWAPKGQNETVDKYLKSLPPELLPVKGSQAAQDRKQMLQKQIPIHDIDPAFCHDLTNDELKKMNEYVAQMKENSVGVGQIVSLANILKGNIHNVNSNEAAITASRFPMGISNSENIAMRQSQASNLATHRKNLRDLQNLVPLPLDTIDETQNPIMSGLIKDINYSNFTEDDNFEIPGGQFAQSLPRFQQNVHSGESIPYNVNRNQILNNLANSSDISGNYNEGHNPEGLPYNVNRSQISGSVANSSNWYGGHNANSLTGQNASGLPYELNKMNLIQNIAGEDNVTTTPPGFGDNNFLGGIPYDVNRSQISSSLANSSDLTGLKGNYIANNVRKDDNLSATENLPYDLNRMHLNQNIAAGENLVRTENETLQQQNKETKVPRKISKNLRDLAYSTFGEDGGNYNQLSGNDTYNSDDNYNRLTPPPVVPGTAKFLQGSSSNNNTEMSGHKKPLAQLYPGQLEIPEDLLNPQQITIGAISDIQYPDITLASNEQNKFYNDLLPEQGKMKQQPPNMILPNCHHCKKSFKKDEFAVSVDRSDALYHAACFKCYGCNQILADNLYFYHNESNNIYCGRDYAKIRGIPRCNACDELIFTKEYCLAQEATFHLKHFCCFYCDTPLAGQNYLVEDSNALCIPCFEQNKADKCKACLQIIKPDEPGLTLAGLHFHATDECFACKVCKLPMFERKMLLRNEKLYCSHDCFGQDQG